VAKKESSENLASWRNIGEKNNGKALSAKVVSSQRNGMAHSEWQPSSIAINMAKRISMASLENGVAPQQPKWQQSRESGRKKMSWQ
jgi:hypothetical protein